MRYLVGFCRRVTAVMYILILGLLAAAIVFVLGYAALQLYYLIGFLYKLYTYQL